MGRVQDEMMMKKRTTRKLSSSSSSSSLVVVIFGVFLFLSSSLYAPVAVAEKDPTTTTSTSSQLRQFQMHRPWVRPERGALRLLPLRTERRAGRKRLPKPVRERVLGVLQRERGR